MAIKMLVVLLFAAPVLSLRPFNSCRRPDQRAVRDQKGLGFDINTAITSDQADCLWQKYPAVFGFRAAGCKDGNKFFIDPTLCQNTNTAWSSLTQFYFNYVEACPKDPKLPAHQMQELADYLVNKCGRKLAHTQSLYIGVLGSAGNGANNVWHASTLSSGRKPNTYHPDTSQNIELVKDYVAGWNKQTGSGLGTLGWLFSSKSDWDSITGSTTYFESSIIWFKVLNRSFLHQLYRYINGDNSTGTDDWFNGQAFGGWPSPDAKQYNQNVNACNVTLNEDVFYVSL